MFRTTTLGRSLLALASVSMVSAHGHVTEILIDGESHYGHDPTKVPWGPQPDSISWSNGATDNGFVPSSAAGLASEDIVCHRDATNGVLTASVSAGSTVRVRWWDWPHAHWGPVVDYMARCENADCTTVDKTELEFFKIAELGQLTRGTTPGTPGNWANNELREDNYSWNITIPKELAPGSYVLRHEIIALHMGGAEGSTQMYPQCINLVVDGDGTARPEGVPATELYSSKDAGLLHNVFNDEWSDAEYVIPGPPVVQL